MKKLLFSALFALGFFVATEAQPIFFQVRNTSATDTWAFKVTDGANVSFDINIPPGATSNLAPASWPSFVFPLTWGAANVTTGCSSNGVIGGYGAGTGFFPCPASMIWQLTLGSVISPVPGPAAFLRVNLQ